VGIEGFLSRVRTATVVTACETELLVIDKDDYREVILSKNSEYDTAQRLKMVKNFPMIKALNLDVSFIHQLVMRAETKVFEQGITIMSEGQMNGDIFFIINGTISVRKAIKWYHSDSMKVSAMNNKGVKKKSARPSIISPTSGPLARRTSISYRSSENAQTTEEPWSKLELEISCLQGGQVFPELAQPCMFENTAICSRSADSPDKLTFTATELSNQIDIEIKRKLNELDYEYPAYATIVTEAPTTCLVISRLDLLRVSPTILIQNIFESLDECYVTEKEIKKEYIEKLEWETYKHGVVEDTCAEIKTLKGLQQERLVNGRTRRQLG
jgi:CRP-like cAMP-binding protein